MTTSLEKTERIRINVGGRLYDTTLATLRKIPDTRLSRLALLGRHDPSYDANKGEFYFDRHSYIFEDILNYCRSGELHLNSSNCGNIIKSELHFWGLHEQEIEACCWNDYSKFTQHKETLRDMELHCFERRPNANSMVSIMDGNANIKRITRKPSLKNRIWAILEHPQSSRGAKMYAIVSMFMVILSIAIFILETHHVFQIDGKSKLSMVDIIEKTRISQFV